MTVLNMDWLEARMVQSSLLLGFAVAILVALIAIRDMRKRTTLAIVVFTCASFMLLMDNYSITRLLTVFATLPQPIDPLLLEKYSALYAGVKWIGIWGFLLLIAGIGCVGWIHSRLAGILSTLGALLAVIYVLRFVWLLMGIGGG